MMKIRLSLIGFLLLAVLGHAYSANYKHGSKPVRFIVLSDIHISKDEDKAERLKDFVKYYNENLAKQTDFVITTGDNVSYWLADKNVSRDSLSNNKLRTFVNIMSDLKDPYYTCMGNHEYKIDSTRDSDGFFPEEEILSMENVWKSETGFKPYYSMDKKGYKFIFLNSMKGRFQNKFFDNQQIDWLKDELKTTKNVLLFFHHPLQTDHPNYWCRKTSGLINKNVEPELYELLSKYRDKIKAVFVGHGHRWVHDKLFNSVDVYETASFRDYRKFMFYSVDLSSSGITVEKSTDL